MSIYMRSLVGKIFKILPLREAEDRFLHEYLDSLQMEMNGAYITFSQLRENQEYVSVLSIVGYLTTHVVSVAQCKREVFKAIRLVEQLTANLGGDAGD